MISGVAARTLPSPASGGGQGGGFTERLAQLNADAG
jgi:hypothetical protein